MALDISKFSFGKKSADKTEEVVESKVEPEVESKVEEEKPKPRLSFSLGAAKAEVAEAVAEPEESKPEPAPAPAPAPEVKQTPIEIRPSEPEVVEIKGFRETLDDLDSLFVEGTGFTSLTIDVARSRIVTAMRELKEDPALMQIVTDTDLRNIMAFINQSADKARDDFAEKSKKREVRTNRKARAMKLDFADLGAGIVDASKPKMELKDLAKMDFGSMAIKK